MILRERPGIATVLVAVLLVGLGALLAVPGSRPFHALERQRQAQQRLAAAERALVAFAVREGRLPRPATPGRRDEGPEGTTAVLVGVLPLDALDPVEGVDPWGRTLTYAVTAALTRPGAWSAGTSGLLAVESDHAPPRTTLDWVLVSHGANGHGAWRPPGPRDPLPDGPLERDNLGQAPDADPAHFQERRHDRGQAEGFDDVLRAGTLPR
ncbi:hypothetical protein [Pararhodospirillum photometricum]|nr:hypothetical protein [Pararhodospirillum photometricum]